MNNLLESLKDWEAQDWLMFACLLGVGAVVFLFGVRGAVGQDPGSNLGACCYWDHTTPVPTMSCIYATRPDCENNWTGVFQGRGTSCHTDPCQIDPPEVERHHVNERDAGRIGFVDWIGWPMRWWLPRIPQRSPVPGCTPG